MSELMILPTNKAQLLDVFVSEDSRTQFESLINEIKEKAKDLPLDVTLKKNQEEISSFAYSISRTKTAIDKAGKELVDEYKELPKRIDAARKFYRDELDALRDQVLKPVKEHKEALEKIKAKQDQILTELANSENLSAVYESLEVLELALLDIKSYDFSDFEDRKELAEGKQAIAILKLKNEIELAKKYKKEKEEAEKQAELERIAAEKRRIEQAKEEERARAAAELKAAQERAEREKQKAIEELERKQREELARIERERQQAERKQRDELERIKREQAQEAERIERERIAREQNRAHQAKINSEILSDILDNTNLSNDDAKHLIKIIINKKIRHLEVIY